MGECIHKSGNNYELNIAVLNRYWCEGGLTIFMTDEKENIVTALTFNFEEKDDGKN